MIVPLMGGQLHAHRLRAFTWGCKRLHLRVRQGLTKKGCFGLDAKRSLTVEGPSAGRPSRAGSEGTDCLC
jgi:hypothetical protein